MKDIFVHAGMWKTGTTSIQETLYAPENIPILNRNGYLYPRCLPANHSYFFYCAFNDHPEYYHENIRKGYSLQEIKEINEKNLSNLKREVEEARPDKLIFSAESIPTLTLDGLNRMKNYLESNFGERVNIHLIVYVRNHLKWAVSDCQEKIKSGKSKEVALYETIKGIRDVFSNFVGRVLKVFGEKAKVFSFDDAIKHPQGLVGHFLSIVGFSQKEISEFRIVRANESISLVAADIMSYVNEKMPLDVGGRIHERRYDGDYHALMRIRGPKFDLSNRDKQKVFENSQEDIRWLKENCGIDYSNAQLVFSEEERVLFDEETIRDIETAYHYLSIPVKEVVLEYIQNQFYTRPHLRELYDKLSKDFAVERRFIDQLGIKETIDRAEIYREIALMLEHHNQIEQAKMMMEKALMLRPHGPFIQAKIKEYEERLKIKGSA